MSRASIRRRRYRPRGSFHNGSVPSPMSIVMGRSTRYWPRRWPYRQWRGCAAGRITNLFGLIAVTGMRLSEAIGLHHGDVDLKEGVLTVRQAKFGKSRLLPLHPTTRAALRSYAERRDRHLRPGCGPNFFVAERGGRLRKPSIYAVFWRLSHEIGLRRPGDNMGPRIHD